MLRSATFSRSLFVAMFGVIALLVATLFPALPAHAATGWASLGSVTVGRNATNGNFTVSGSATAVARRSNSTTKGYGENTSSIESMFGHQEWMKGWNQAFSSSDTNPFSSVHQTYAWTEEISLTMHTNGTSIGLGGGGH